MKLLVLIICIYSLACYSIVPIRKGMPQQTKDGAVCPVNENATEADFPGTKADASFSRNQDTVGFCRNFSTVDMICHGLKSLKRWPYDSKCSVADMVLQYYKYLHKKDPSARPMTIPDLIKDITVDSTFLNKFSHEVGFCPEISFPSEFINNAGLGNFKDHYDAASKKLTEAKVSLPGYCKECEEMAPVLSQSQWTLVNNIAQSDRSAEGAFKALDKMNELSCPDSKRIKLPEDYFMTPTDFKFTKEAQFKPNAFMATLYYGNPVEITVWADKIHPGDPKNYPHAEHSTLVVGAYIDGSDGKCYYVIKNSWSLDCRSVPETTDLKCDKTTGAILMTWEGLMNATSKASPNYLASSSWREKGSDGK